MDTSSINAIFAPMDVKDNKMSTSMIVTGLLSFGMSGRVFHAPFINMHEGFRLKAVLERNNKTAGGYYPGIISYDHIEEIMGDGEIDLIIVNTPTNMHYEHARLALLAGKNVLVEKPAVVTAQQLVELYRLAEQQHRCLFVYHNRRWDSDFRSVKKVIESGRLGPLVEVHFRFDRYKILLGNKGFKETADTPGNGLLYDLGPHLLDQVISLFGKPVFSHKITASHRPGSKVVDYFSFQLLFPGQLTVYVTGSLLVAHAMPAFVVHGTKGSFIKQRGDVQESQLIDGADPADSGYGREPDGLEGQLFIIGEDNTKELVEVTAEKGNYKGLFDAVFETIRNGAGFPIKKEELIWQIELLES